MTTLPEHALCPACGAMACPHFTAELRTLREAASPIVKPLAPPARAASDLETLVRRLANLERRWRGYRGGVYDEVLDEMDAAVRDLDLTTPTKKKGPDHV